MHAIEVSIPGWGYIHVVLARSSHSSFSIGPFFVFAFLGFTMGAGAPVWSGAGAPKWLEVSCDGHINKAWAQRKKKEEEKRNEEAKEEEKEQDDKEEGDEVLLLGPIMREA